MPDGRLLADLVAADPRGWLGAEHVELHGIDPTFIVKLVDAGERLFLHAHPDRTFAHDHLASPYGKAEGWVILEANPGAVVHLGFSRDVGVVELAGWVAHQDTAKMIEATNKVPVSAGDAVFCPGGLPHAIGAGILFAEIQEPTDLTVLLEWHGFPVNGPETGHLGLGFETALGCVDRARWDPTRVTELFDTRSGSSSPVGVTRLLPPAADAFFTVEHIVPAVPVELSARFSVLLVTDGHGIASFSSSGPIDLGRGQALVVPHAAGSLTLSGAVSVLRFGAAR
jgi:mannose-6-phosphate isomerase